MNTGVFIIQGISQQEGSQTATLNLDRSHAIFSGHFPGQPVVPGACMLALVKEVLSAGLKKNLLMEKAANIKFMQMITPQNAADITLSIIHKPAANGTISVNAVISNADTACFKLQAVFRSI